ncbi:conjugal transfer protein TraF, partial [Pantoea sp. B_10]
MKKRKTALALLLLGSVFSATGKDAGWQWYNESHRTPEDDKSSSAQPQQASPDIMEKLATLQQATKRAMYEAILYPGVENFTRY